MHRQIHKSRHIYVLLISIALFTLGVLLGAQVEQFRIEKLEKEFMEESQKFEDIQAEIDYINFIAMSNNSISCDSLIDTYLTSVKNLDDSLFSLENYVSTAQFDLDEYYLLQNRYFNLEMRYYILAETVNSMCNSNFNTILYFYAEQEKCPECEDQGVYLDYVKKKYADEVMIFSFDIESSSNVVHLLVRNNDIVVDNLPKLIINGNSTLDFSDSETIEKHLEVSLN